MAEKARKSRVRFRPHFKTHQSAEVGEWFRYFGVTSITVSSLSMAEYFADYRWNDITVAFPVNLRQTELMKRLAARIRLNVLVLDEETVEALDELLDTGVGVWIKIDTGYGRTGIRWDRGKDVVSLARRIEESKHLSFKGLLTHTGQSYHVHSKEKRAELFSETARVLGALRDQLADAGIDEGEISVGDTPGTTAVERFEGVDEVRPGNFVFFDVQQYHLGSCTEDEIAMAVACPVVALHPERGEMVLYGGAVHLSAQAEEHPDGGKMYGYVVPLKGEQQASWCRIDPASCVRMVSQEHGVVRCSPDLLASTEVADLVAVLPVHSCLSEDLIDDAMDTAGRRIMKGRF